jgi:hypothetical protein
METKKKRSPQNRSFFHPLLIAIFLVLLTNSGCSVYMAAKQPGEKNLSVLAPGTHRGLVIAELGAPVWSGDKHGEKTDVFVFTQGYSAGARTARAVFHGTADFFTLGLWEVISTPTEAYFSGDEMKLEVVYGPDDMVKTSRVLSGGKVEPAPNAEPVDSAGEPKHAS